MSADPRRLDGYFCGLVLAAHPAALIGMERAGRETQGYSQANRSRGLGICTTSIVQMDAEQQLRRGKLA